MHDSRLEDLLRQTFRTEADALVLTVTTDVIQQRLAGRRRQARTQRGWLLAAAVATVTLAGAAAAFVGSLDPSPVVPPTPNPAVVLPEPASLLADFPDATLKLERSVGPADQPIAPDATAVPGASPAPIEVGRITFGGPFVIAMACLGDGEMVAAITTPSLDVPYTQASGPCDGKPIISEYLAPPIDPGSDGDVVTVTVNAGNSWRLAVGERPASVIAEPEFAPIYTTSGWNVVSRATPHLLSDAVSEGPTTGARVTMPDTATRAGVFVQCHGSGTLTVTVNDSSPTDVACDSSGTTRRIEFPAVGGEPLALSAKGDRGGLWVTLTVEANAEITSIYPSAPPLPKALAAVPYVAPDANVVAFGTLGSSRQTILPIQGARPGQPAGDLLPVAVSNMSTGAHLELVSVSSGAVVRDLATISAPAFIFDSWADASHGQVFYAVATESGVDFHRVTVQGSDDEVLATVPREGQTGFTAALAADESVFVVDACLVGPLCMRTIVDARTGATTRADRTTDPLCRILRIVDDTIVATSRPDCRADTQTSLLAIPVEGGSPAVIASAPVPEVADGVVVATPDGLKVAYGMFGPEGPITKVLDVASGTTADLAPGSVGDPTLIPDGKVSLPEGWLLLSGGGLGDFPWQKSFDRPAPVLVNLATGERIELVNLPHWVGNYGG